MSDVDATRTAVGRNAQWGAAACVERRRSLAAFLDGLQELSRQAGGEAPVIGASAPPILLSNGFNADAGVAQLVSALASLHDGNIAFNATPFAAASDQSLDGAIAAAPQ